MTGVVYSVACGAGCFALGCCGSPMLPVWVGLFGAKWAQASGPAIFGITLASLALGLWLLRKKSARGCATTCGDRCEG